MSCCVVRSVIVFVEGNEATPIFTGEFSGCGGRSLLRSLAPAEESAGEVVFEGEWMIPFNEASEERGVCLDVVEAKVARNEGLSYAKGSLPEEAEDLRDTAEREGCGVCEEED